MAGAAGTVVAIGHRRAPVTNDDLLNALDVAHLFGVGRKMPYWLIKRGALPATGCARQVRRADAKDYLRQCRMQPGQLRHLNQYPSPVTKVRR